MSTFRARWFILIGLVGLVISMGSGNDRAALPCLAIVLWVGGCWLRFSVATNATEELFSDLRRVIGGVADTVQIISVDQTYRVHCSVTPAFSLRQMRVTIEDLVPAGCHLPTSPSWVVVDCDGSPIRWEYALRPVVTGPMRLLGFQVHLTDRFGFFRRSWLVRLERELTVLPMVVRPNESVSVLKRDNIQILNGGHRFRRSGTGMELLGIRDYQFGDPPRNIAWKATARRGHPMTCEFESEVPIRSTLIADLSACQYQGRPGPATADRIIAAVASIGRILLAQRDPVGCTLVADTHRTMIRHGHGERQLTRIFKTVFAHGRQHCAVSEFSIDDLVSAVWNAATRRFPSLMHHDLNPPKASFFHMGKTRRTLAAKRRQVAYLWACLGKEAIASISRWRFDDDAFREAAARFVDEYSIGLRPPARRFDIDLDLQSRNRSMQSLCQSLIAGITRAKDNELFVLVSQLPVDEDDTDRLVETIRLAQAKHHRTVFVEAQSPQAALPDDPTANRLLRGMQQGIMDRRREELKKRLVGLGAKMASLDNPRLVETVLAELNLLKQGRVGSVSAS